MDADLPSLSSPQDHGHGLPPEARPSRSCLRDPHFSPNRRISRSIGAFLRLLPRIPVPSAFCLAMLASFLHQAAGADAIPLEVLSRNAAQAARDGKTKEALRLYNEWVDRDPMNPLARASRGAAFYQDKQWANARKELERAVLMEPMLAASWATLGLLYDQAGEEWLALSAYTRAVHLEPKVARHRILLALALEKRGWPDAAESALIEASSLDPQSSDAQFNLAALALRRTPPALETARRHYLEARRLGALPDADIDAILAGGKNQDKDDHGPAMPATKPKQPKDIRQDPPPNRPLPGRAPT